MPASSLRRWLRRHPHPARLRVDGRDLAIASGANHWATTEESVIALTPTKIEAIGDNGVCLRAMTMGDGDDGAPDAAAATSKSETEITVLARLIGEAHDAGARRHAEAYSLAFSENTKLVQILAARLGGLETAWQQAMMQTAQAHADALYAQAQGGDAAGEAVGTMLATALGGGLGLGSPKPAKLGAAKANGNGAAAKKGD